MVKTAELPTFNRRLLRELVGERVMRLTEDVERARIVAEAARETRGTVIPFGYERDLYDHEHPFRKGVMQDRRESLAKLGKLQEELAEAQRQLAMLEEEKAA